MGGMICITLQYSIWIIILFYIDVEISVQFLQSQHSHLHIQFTSLRCAESYTNFGKFAKRIFHTPDDIRSIHDLQYA